MSRSILLAGSVQGSSAADVLEKLAKNLGPQAKRLPDGETGARSRWIAWQADILGNGSGLKPTVKMERGPNDFVQRYTLAPGAKEVTFDDLGYAAAAAESYETFKRLRSEGVIAQGTRFQVCLPTPLGVILAFVEPEGVALAWRGYEKAMANEVAKISAAIPARDLALQWDIAVEPVFLLGNPDMLKAFPLESLVSSIARASAPLSADAELGLHMCFGDTGQKFAISPDDLGQLVEFANLLVAGMGRPVAWVHFPAPKKTDYSKFFAPLANFKGQGAEIYIGLIVPDDGFDGAKQRLDAVTRIVPNVGVAAECGIGRRPPETLPAMLDLHKQVAAL